MRASKLRLATINAEVTKTVRRGRVDVVALQEEHFKNKGVQTLLR